MRDRDKVVAIACSDIHLSLRPPPVRRGEKNWFDAMARPLREITSLASHYDVPVLCAGDLFDHWRSEPELVNFALANLPHMYAIPGQHDLPLHNLDLVKRSSWWTLAMAGKITPLLSPAITVVSEDVAVRPFPWGVALDPWEGEAGGKLKVLLAHDYLWIPGHGFPGADEAKRAGKRKRVFSGYNVAIFGDNHRGFVVDVGGVTVMNCGGLTRRRSDERDCTPQVGLICRSGKIIPHRISTARDSFGETSNFSGERRQVVDMRRFIEGLADVHSRSFDFIVALRHAIEHERMSAGVRKVLLEALEICDG